MKRQLSAGAIAIALPLALHAQTRLDTVLVTATRQPQHIDETLSDVTILTRDEIEQAGQSTVQELLSLQPGLELTTTGGPGANSGIFIRGANTGHTLVLVDGIPFTSATAGQASLESLPLSHIERIEIVRGPASALYGPDALGGVIQIFTRRGEGRPRLDAFAGAGTYDTREAQLGYSGSTGPVAFSLKVGHYQTDAFDAFGQPEDRDGFKQDQASGRLSVELPRQGELSAHFLRTSGINEYDSAVPMNTRADKKAAITGARWRQPVFDAWTSTLVVGESVDDVTFIDSGFDSALRTKRRLVSWQNDVKLPVGTVLAAIERTDERVRNTSTELSVTERDTDSVLAGWSARLGAHRVQLNARHDDNSQFGGKSTGSASYGYHFNPQWRAYVAAGTAFKAPTFNDLYFPLTCFTGFGCFGGNPDLRPEQARNREAGMTWQGSSTRVSLVHYNNRIRDLIVWSNQPFNVGRARIRGTTVTLDWLGSQWDAAVTATFQDAEDADTGLPLIRRAERHLTARAARRAGAWRYGVDWKASGPRDDLDFNTGARVRLGGYGVIGAFVHYAFAPDWKIEVRGNNLGDKRYRHAFGFATPGANVFVGVRYAPD